MTFPAEPPPPPPGPGSGLPPAAGYYPPAGQPLPWAPPPAPAEPWVTRTEIRVAAVVALVLVVLGVLAGLVWRQWTVTTHGFDIGNGIIIPDETEGWVGGDAHFAVVTGVIGLLAGPIAWRLRAVRGPVMAAGLAVGGVLGALVAAGVGHLLGGGGMTVQPNTNYVPRLPLSVHAHGLLVIEAALALAGYLVATLLADRDDLGVPAPAPPGRHAAGSLAEHGPQGLGWHGNGPGGPQQRDLPTQ